MSEAARARERLDFEAAAEAIEKGKQGKGSKLSTPSFVDFSTAGVLQFTSGGVEVWLSCGIFCIFPVSFVFKLFDISFPNSQRKVRKLKISWQRKCTRRGKSFNGVLHLFSASAMISLILTWGRYFK